MLAGDQTYFSAQSDYIVKPKVVERKNINRRFLFYAFGKCSLVFQKSFKSCLMNENLKRPLLIQVIKKKLSSVSF